MIGSLGDGRARASGAVDRPPAERPPRQGRPVLRVSGAARRAGRREVVRPASRGARRRGTPARLLRRGLPAALDAGRPAARRPPAPARPSRATGRRRRPSKQADRPCRANAARGPRPSIRAWHNERRSAVVSSGLLTMPRCELTPLEQRVLDALGGATARGTVFSANAGAAKSDPKRRPQSY